MRNIITGLLFSILMIPAVTAGSIDGGVSYGSDYIFRGVSQSGNPAASGWVDLSTDNGFYAGVWGSEVDFSSTGDLDTGREVDYYGGYALQVSDNISLDTGYLRYTYDGSVVEDIEEVYTILTYSNFTGALYQDLDTHDNYAEFSYQFGWLFDNAFQASVIHGIFDDDNDFTMLKFGKSFGSRDQFDFSVLVGQDVFEGQASDSLTASVTYNFERNI